MKDEIINGQGIRCYDNGKSDDRYTVIYMDQPERGHRFRDGTCLYSAVGMNGNPFHPQGIGQHCTASPGKHLGKRIHFVDLPVDCQKLVQQDTKETV